MILPNTTLPMYMWNNPADFGVQNFCVVGTKQPFPPVRFQGLQGDWIVCHARAATQSRAAGGRSRSLICDLNAVCKTHDEFIWDAEMLTREIDKLRVVKRPVLLWAPQALSLLGAAKQQGTSASDNCTTAIYCMSVDSRTHDLVCIGSVQLHVQPSAAKLAWVIGSCWREAPMSCDQWRHCHEVECCARGHIGFMKLIGTNMEAEGKCSRRERMTSHDIAPHSVTWQHAKAAKATRASPKNNALRHLQRIDRVLQYIALAKSCQFSKLPNLSVAMLAASAASSFAFRRPAPWLLGLPWQVSMN